MTTLRKGHPSYMDTFQWHIVIFFTISNPCYVATNLRQKRWPQKRGIIVYHFEMVKVWALLFYINISCNIFLHMTVIMTNIFLKHKNLHDKWCIGNNHITLFSVLSVLAMICGIRTKWIWSARCATYDERDRLWATIFICHPPWWLSSDMRKDAHSAAATYPQGSKEPLLNSNHVSCKPFLDYISFGAITFV